MRVERSNYRPTVVPMQNKASLLLLLILTFTILVLPSRAYAQSIEDFASGSYVQHVKLSPSGNQYAMVTFKRGGGKLVGVYNRKTQKREAGMTVPRAMNVNWVEWASAETLLISITTGLKIEGRKVFWPSARVVSLATLKERPIAILFDDEEKILRSNILLNRVVDMLPEDPNHIIMGAWRSGDFDLFMTNVLTGDAQRVAKGRDLTLAWFTDINGRPSIRMDCSSRACSKIKAYRPKDGSNPNDERTDWVFFRAFDQDDIEEETFLNLQPIGPTGNPDEYYVLDGRDEMPRRTVRIYNIRTDEFMSTVFEDPNYDVKSVLIDPRTRKYAGAAIWRDRVDYVLVDKGLQEHLEGINRYFGDSWNITIRQVSTDRSAALIFASASDERGAYYIYDFETRDTKKIASLNPNLHNAIDTQTETLSIPTRDGIVLTGYHTQPEDGGNGGLVVLVHGGPEARDVLDYDKDVQFLASRGYQVLRVNFRGSSGYGREFARAGYKQWGGVMHTDVIDAALYIQARGNIDPAKTCIMGHSYGGFAALLAGALQPDLFSCVVAGSGPSDLNRALKDERERYGKDSRQLAYWEKAIGDRREDKSALSAISPIRLAEYYDDPVLLIHGSRDRTVSVEHSRRMKERLEKLGKPVEFLEVNGGHIHSRWSSKSRRSYLETLENFLKSHISESEPLSSREASP